MALSDQFWWEATEDDLPRTVYDYVLGLEEGQFEHQEKLARYAWLYDGSQLSGVQTSLSAGPYPIESGPVTENVIESVIDTAKSLIAKNRPKATFVTDGADWKTQRRAKDLEKFIEGEFHRTKVYSCAVEVFRDACVYGTGCMFIYEDHRGRIAVERVPIDEIRVDEEETRAAPPRQIHRVRYADKSVLKAAYPKFKTEIDAAAEQHENHPYSTYHNTKPGQVVVIESWHLPSPGADPADGRHTIIVRGAALVDEKWTSDCFPFVFYRWSKKMTGFYGRGLAEILSGLQIRINRHNRVIAKAQDLLAVPRVLVPAADAGLSVKITNQVGQIIPYRAGKPEFITPPAMSPEIYQDKQNLKAAAYQISGVSELSANAKKPGGLDSGAALREFNDIETQRFSIQAQDYEAFFLEIAEQFVALAKEIYGRKNHTAVWKSRNLVKRIKWSDVDMDADLYQMSIEASSILSRTPAGRLQGAIELVQSGIIDPKEALRLLGHPDLERERDLATASAEDIEATIEDLLDGNYKPPEPLQDLDLGLKRVQMAYLKARRDGAPESVLEDMRRWSSQAQQMMAMATQAAAPPQPNLAPMPGQQGPLQPGSPMAMATGPAMMQSPNPIGAPA